MDHILIRDLRLQTRVGVEENERAHRQNVLVTMDIETDVTTAATSDDLADTVDYDRVVRDVAALVEGGERRLLEHLAEQVATVISRFNGVRGVTVEIAKEAPPVPQVVGQIAVRIHRRFR